VIDQANAATAAAAKKNDAIVIPSMLPLDYFHNF
jgi:hypothetical protein